MSNFDKVIKAGIASAQKAKNIAKSQLPKTNKIIDGTKSFVKNHPVGTGVVGGGAALSALSNAMDTQEPTELDIVELLRGQGYTDEEIMQIISQMEGQNG